MFWVVFWIVIIGIGIIFSPPVAILVLALVLFFAES